MNISPLSRDDALAAAYRSCILSFVDWGEKNGATHYELPWGLSCSGGSAASRGRSAFAPDRIGPCEPMADAAAADAHLRQHLSCRFRRPHCRTDPHQRWADPYRRGRASGGATDRGEYPERSEEPTSELP